MAAPATPAKQDAQRSRRNSTEHRDKDVVHVIDDDGEDIDRVPSSDSSLAITAECRKCSTTVGEFYNAWIKISGSYYLPALRSSYRVLGLKESGKARPALGSELDGCEIRPLLCTTCNETLAILCTKAAAEKPTYSGREFFKLTKIMLLSDSTRQEVNPMLEEPRLEGKAMMLAPQPNADVEKSLLAVQKPQGQEHDRRGSSPMTASTQMHPSKEAVSPPNPSPHEQMGPPAGRPQLSPKVNGHYSPTEQNISLDAISRLQTQIAYNTAGLQTQKRTLVRIDNAVGRLQMEMQHVLSVVESLKVEVRSRAANAPAAKAPEAGGQDMTELEMFASNLSSVANKANEVDGLKLQLELLKRRIKRLEEGGSAQLASITPQHDSPSAHPSSNAQPSAPTSHRQAPAAPIASPGPYRMAAPQVDMRRPSMSHSVPTQDTPQTLQHSSQVNKWVTVNPSAKRPLPNGVDAVPYQVEDLGSTKRPKLAPLEPRRAYEAAPRPDIIHDRIDADDVDVRNRTVSHESYASSTTSAHGLPYQSTNERDPEESWRPESQRHMSVYDHEPRSPNQLSRGRGGGRGRGRKSLPANPGEMGTPEWERGDWTGSQVNSDGYYQPITPAPPGKSGRGVILRTTDSFGGTASIRHTDPYAHTKKTRTKPTRNADGVLVRKDGRPDMRSQSSAANLRKVHARTKDGRGRSSEPSDIQNQQAHTPTSALATAPVVSADSPDISDSVATPEESTTVAPPSTQDRHEVIMSKMFPHGVEEQRRRMSVADHMFSHDGSPRQGGSPEAARARSEQGERDGSSGSPGVRSADGAVQEQSEREIAESAPQQPSPAISNGSGEEMSRQASVAVA